MAWKYWGVAVQDKQIPNYAFFSPAPVDDCWKYGLTSCDKWLHGWLTPLINKSAVFSHSVFFITYDEGWVNDTQSSNGTAKGGGHVALLAVSPYACKGNTSQVPYNHYDLLTTTEWLLGLGNLPNPAQNNWTADPPMKDLFCFPPSNGSGAPAGGSPSIVGTLDPAEWLMAVTRPSMGTA